MSIHDGNNFSSGPGVTISNIYWNSWVECAHFVFSSWRNWNWTRGTGLNSIKWLFCAWLKAHCPIQIPLKNLSWECYCMDNSILNISSFIHIHQITIDKCKNNTCNKRNVWDIFANFFTNFFPHFLVNFY